MQKVASFIFCVASLALVTGAMWLLFPHAAMSVEEVEASKTPMSAEMFDDVDLGDFGLVPVLNMMQHYIDSPPADAGEPDAKVRFQGC